MKNILHKPLKFIFMIAFFSLCFYSKVFAEVNLDDWQYPIEKAIIDSYKIKSEEANVAKLRDQDSKISSIVEAIQYGNSQNEDTRYTLNPNAFSSDVNEFAKNWAQILCGYAADTGWIRGDYAHITDDTSGQYGYVFISNNTEVYNQYSNPSNWGSTTSSTVLNNINADIQNVKNIYSGNISISYQIICSAPDTTTNPGYTYYYYQFVPTVRDDVSGETIPTSLSTITGTYWAKNDGSSKYDTFTTDVNNRIKSDITNAFNTITKAAFDKRRNVNEDYKFEKELLDRINFTDFFNTTPSYKGQDGGSSWSTGTTIKYAITAKQVPNAIKLDNDTIINNWQDLVWYASQSDDVFWLSLPNGRQNNVFYKARKESFIYFISNIFSPLWASKFKITTDTLDAACITRLYRSSYSDNGNTKTILYEGATFDNGHIVPTISGTKLYLLVTSGYTYQPGEPFTYKSNTIANYLNALEYDTILELMLNSNIKAFANISRYGIDNPVSMYEHMMASQDAIARDIKAAMKPLMQNGTLVFKLPRRYDLIFDDTSIVYAPYLTTSCIVNNQVNRYEFWARNVSNELDKDYYGDAKLLLPEEIPDNPNTDGFLSAEKHTVKLDVSKHWGIFLITRYKYVDYIYKIYYGFTDKSATEHARFAAVASSQRVVWDYDNATLLDNQGINNGQIIGYANMIAPNEYGWFWRFTYSERELSGGYYLTPEDVANEENTIRTHLMQNIEDDNDIQWLTTAEITTPNKYNNYQTIWDARNNYALTPGKGDMYKYKNPVRAETIYYQVNVNYSVGPNGQNNVEPYVLSLGSDKRGFDCLDVITLCDCEEEDGGCSLDTNELRRTSTLTN